MDRESRSKSIQVPRSVLLTDPMAVPHVVHMRPSLSLEVQMSVPRRLSTGTVLTRFVIRTGGGQIGLLGSAGWRPNEEVGVRGSPGKSGQSAPRGPPRADRPRQTRPAEEPVRRQHRQLSPWRQRPPQPRKEPS